VNDVCDLFPSDTLPESSFFLEAALAEYTKTLRANIFTSWGCKFYQLWRDCCTVRRRSAWSTNLCL